MSEERPKSVGFSKRS